MDITADGCFISIDGRMVRADRVIYVTPHERVPNVGPVAVHVDGLQGPIRIRVTVDAADASISDRSEILAALWSSLYQAGAVMVRFAGIFVKAAAIVDFELKSFADVFDSARSYRLGFHLASTTGVMETEFSVTTELTDPTAFWAEVTEVVNRVVASTKPEQDPARPVRPRRLSSTSQPQLGPIRPRRR